MEFSKAFSLLLQKLNSYWIEGRVYSCIECFLTDLTQEKIIEVVFALYIFKPSILFSYFLMFVIFFYLSLFEDEWKLTRIYRVIRESVMKRTLNRRTRVQGSVLFRRGFLGGHV
jgi:hypothetical protein